MTTVRVDSGPRTAVQWFPADAVPGDVGFPGAEAVRAALAGEAPALHVQESPQQTTHLEVFVEPLIPPLLLVIAGGGPVGQAVALQADLVGFEVVVIDDRKEFVDPSLYPPGVEARCGDIAREVAEIAGTPDACVVLVTRGHQQDRAALAACIRKPAVYIGMIGSRRKVAMLFEDLRASGAATEEELGRVYAPIGLDIGAETVPEIATSIVAQLIAVRRRGAAPRMPRG